MATPPHPTHPPLSLSQVRSSHGLNPAHLCVSAAARLALASNYNGGSVAAYALEVTNRVGAHPTGFFDVCVGGGGWV